METIDIWRSASLLLEEHGDRAEFVAAAHGDTFFYKGDYEGCAVWMMIIRAIGELRQKSREADAGFTRARAHGVQRQECGQVSVSDNSSEV